MLAWPVLLVAVLLYRDWHAARFPDRPPEPERPTARVQHPVFHPIALRALEGFRTLPAAERQAVRRNLERTLTGVDDWLRHLETADPRVLCLGELHRPATRRFLARQLLSRLPVDRLLLEATPSEMRLIHRLAGEGAAYVPLLGADVGEILEAVRTANPAVTIHGIEETSHQASLRGNRGARDRSIAVNFWRHYQPGQRHAVLYGALHCSERRHRLFGHLRAAAPPELRPHMVNVQILGEHQDGPLEAFVYFLDELGLAPGHLVLPDTGALHPYVYSWFALLDQQVLSQFETLVVFRVAPGEHQEVPAPAAISGEARRPGRDAAEGG